VYSVFRPNDTMVLFQERYMFQPRPLVPLITFSSEGGCANVYELRRDDGVEYGLNPAISGNIQANES
jgi:hypothetical protein